MPTLLTLPSAGTAARAFDTLTTTARKQLRTLASVSGSAFLLAFLLSPRPYRHPYLLYTSLLVAGSRFITSDLVAPYLFLSKPSSAPNSSPSPARKQKRGPVSPAHMEASYEVLGSGLDNHSEGTGSASGEDLEGEEEHTQQMNGEEVRVKVERFLRKQMVQTAVSGLGFAMAVVGIWGDGAVQNLRVVDIHVGV